MSEARFSKDELLQIFRSQRASGELDKHVDSLLLGELAAATHHDDALPGWTQRAEDQRSAPNVSLCWDDTASSHPLSLEDMTREEHEVGINLFIHS